MNDLLSNLTLNQVPGNTPIDQDDIAHLIPNISTQRELNQFEQTNITEANEWAFNPRVLKHREPLTEPYVRELHKRMFRHTWRWAGIYRQKDLLPVGVSHLEIRDQIPALLGNARYWIDNQTFDVDQIAIRVHHRIVWIHPFRNGNGRHARLLADVIAAKNGREQFTWGSITLAAAGPARTEYIRCLQVADANNDDLQRTLDLWIIERRFSLAAC
jgi:Fic-DOC domain mobile mystery protein B